MQLYKNCFLPAACDPIRTNCDPFLGRNPSDENHHIREISNIQSLFPQTVSKGRLEVPRP